VFADHMHRAAAAATASGIFRFDDDLDPRRAGFPPPPERNRTRQSRRRKPRLSKTGAASRRAGCDEAGGVARSHSSSPPVPGSPRQSPPSPHHSSAVAEAFSVINWQITWHTIPLLGYTMQEDQAIAILRRKVGIKLRLPKWLDDRNIKHLRGAPYHPMTQGKIERCPSKAASCWKITSCPAISKLRLPPSSTTTTTTDTTKASTISPPPTSTVGAARLSWPNDKGSNDRPLPTALAAPPAGSLQHHIDAPEPLFRKLRKSPLQ